MSKPSLLILIYFLPSLLMAQVLEISLQGDPLIKNAQFINQLNKTCLYAGYWAEEQGILDRLDKACVFNQLTFPYSDVIENIALGKQRVILTNNQVELILNKSEDFKLDLSLIKNGSKSTIVLYDFKSLDSIGTFSQKRYYINKNNIYILQYTGGEEGLKGDYWKHYIMNFNTGLFDLKKEIVCHDVVDENGDVIYTEKESTIRNCKEYSY